MTKTFNTLALALSAAGIVLLAPSAYADAPADDLGQSDVICYVAPTVSYGGVTLFPGRSACVPVP